MLLTEQADALAVVGQQDVIAVADGRSERHTETRLKPGLVPFVQQVPGFVVKPHRLARPDALPSGKALQPVLPACHTAMHARYAAVAGRKSPCMEEVEPVDIAGHIMYIIIYSMELQRTLNLKPYQF